MARRDFAGGLLQLFCCMLVSIGLFFLLSLVMDWVVTVAEVGKPVQIKWSGPDWSWMLLIYIGLCLGTWLFYKFVNRFLLQTEGSGADYGGDGATYFPVIYDSGDHGGDHGGGDGGDGGGGDGGGGGD